MCTLLPGALDSYRDLLFFSMVYLGLAAVDYNISQSSGVYSRIPANTTDNFNLFFLL